MNTERLSKGKSIEEFQLGLEIVRLKDDLKEAQSQVDILTKERDEYREKYTCNQHTVLNQRAEIDSLKEQLKEI